MKRIIRLLCQTALIAVIVSSCGDKEELKTQADLPTASFSTDKMEYTVGEEVHFADQSVPKLAPIVAYYWHFGFEGQGNNSTEQHPSYTYTKMGKYAVSLTVTDEHGAYATKVDTITIYPENQSPVALFSYTPEIVVEGAEVIFTDQSTDADGTIVSREWNFGNGEISTETNPSTAYATAGFYNVSLTVIDDKGAANTKNTQINVQKELVDFGTLLWSVTYESSSALQHVSPAVGDNGDIYVTSNTMNLHALSPSGNIRWTFDLAKDGVASGQQCSSPVVASDGTVYIGAGYATGGTGAGLYAVHPDGSQKWYHLIWAGARIYYTPPALTPDGHVVIGSRGTNGGIHKIKQTDGTSDWYTKSPTGSGVNGAVVVAKDNAVYSCLSNSATANFGIVKTSAEGVNLFQLGQPYYVSGIDPAIDADGTVYAASEQGVVAAYDPATGTNKWEATGYGKFDYSGIALAESEATLYVGSSNVASPQLIALNKNNGNERWSYPTDAIIQSTPAVDANGIIHFADAGGNYYALNPDGTLKLKQSIGTKVWSSPVISDYGVLYFTVEDSGACKLVAIRINAGPADSPWPQAGQNARRAGMQR
jgi:PKD repeat protein